MIEYSPAHLREQINLTAVNRLHSLPVSRFPQKLFSNSCAAKLSVDLIDFRWRDYGG